MTVTNETGTVLTCTNPECGCRLRIDEPCPHGDNYTCACGHAFTDASTVAMRDMPA